MDGTGDHDVKWYKADSERQIFHVCAHMQNLDLKKMTWMKNRDCFFGGKIKEKGDGLVNTIALLCMHVWKLLFCTINMH
jgi:hypothetical protein